MQDQQTITIFFSFSFREIKMAIHKRKDQNQLKSHFEMQSLK